MLVLSSYDYSRRLSLQCDFESHCASGVIQFRAQLDACKYFKSQYLHKTVLDATAEGRRGLQPIGEKGHSSVPFIDPVG